MKKNKRIYVFDWDDNIMHMPTTIKMEHKVDGKWVIEDLSTQEYAIIRESKEYRYPKGVADPYLNFSNDPKFIADLHKALDAGDFGPSFAKFKECMMYGNDFAIITARGQSQHTILAGIITIIGKTFFTSELNLMLENVGNLNEYLARQVICPVTSKDMDFSELKESGAEDEDEENIQMRKVIALDRYIERKTRHTNFVEFDGKFSVGFSDDDKQNVKSIKSFIEKALKPRYPNLHFVVYDTSNPEKVVKNQI